MPTRDVTHGEVQAMIVLRDLLGQVLRSHRMRQGRTLRQISADARVSLGYISEIERGQKEASSELLAALCTALDVPLSTVLRDVSDLMHEHEVAARPVEVPVPINTDDLPDVVAARVAELRAALTGHRQHLEQIDQYLTVAERLTVSHGVDRLQAEIDFHERFLAAVPEIVADERARKDPS
ncbi:MAG: helix-turn-helix domain-containing protein [Pseudonocardia sp.]